MTGILTHAHTFDHEWDVAIKDATYLADIAYELCPGTLKAKSLAYTEAFTARMDTFRSKWTCPECGVLTPTGRCARCQGV